jgi:hypothetical protein
MITCRINDNIVSRAAAAEGEMVVFLKTSEEATATPEARVWIYTA